MTQGGTEARAQQAALLERTNQIAVLQRELDQWQVKLQAADTSVQREKVSPRYKPPGLYPLGRSISHIREVGKVH